MWTQFWDMSSGGDCKEQFKWCFIEAPEDEAVSVFFARFGHNPHRVTCTCCGPDYSLEEYETLEEATEYFLSPRFGRTETLHLDEFLALDDVRVIRASEITDAERHFEVPQQGYVWAD